jgi:hypothetical protein
MNCQKYIGLDVHQATISVAVMDPTGKLVMQCLLETEASTILEFFAGLRGNLSVAFEEGTSAAWIYNLLKPHVARVAVERRTMQAAIIRWDFPQGHADERNSQRWDKIAGL